MTLTEILEKYSDLSIEEKRCISDDYVWLVFYNKEIDRWSKVFNDIFGPAVKAAGAAPTKDDICLTADYGGIRHNQTLFRKEFDDATVIAMFWPWQDNIRTTVKMILVDKATGQEGMPSTGKDGNGKEQNWK